MLFSWSSRRSKEDSQSLYTSESEDEPTQQPIAFRSSSSDSDVSMVNCDDDFKEIITPKWTVDISELPSELLISIFEYARGSSLDQIDLSLSISQVCRFWRSVALMAPTLWTTIDILKDVELTKQFLDRSNPMLLDIHMSLRPTLCKYEGISRIEQFCSLLTSRHQRLCNVTFHAYYNSWFSASMGLLGDTRLNLKLHSFDIRLLQFFYGEADTSAQECNQLACRFAIQTTHFRLEGFPTSNSGFFTPALMSLDMRWQRYTGNLRRTGGIVPLLTQLIPCINLKYLRLTQAIPDRHETVHHNPNIHMLHLQEIVFEGITGIAIAWFFTCVCTPGLQNLRIDFSGLGGDILDPHWAALPTAMKKNPQLKQLHLKSCTSVPRAKIIKALRHSQSLTHLRLTLCDTNRLILNKLVYTEDHELGLDQVICPKLNTIILEDDMRILPGSLIKLVKSRLDRGEAVPPIKSLTCRGLGPPFNSVKLTRALQDKVPELVVEKVGLWAVQAKSGSESEVEEEWMDSDEEVELDSGDEEVIAAAEFNIIPTSI